MGSAGHTLFFIEEKILEVIVIILLRVVEVVILLMGITLLKRTDCTEM